MGLVKNTEFAVNKLQLGLYLFGKYLEGEENFFQQNKM